MSTLPNEDITIIKAQDVFVVRWRFANGWTDHYMCENERDARVFAEGLSRGITSVKNMIGIGPHFHSAVEETQQPGKEQYRR